MDFILSKFEAGKAEFANHPQLSKMFNSGWSKLDKYYQLTEDTPIYIAALVLNPRHKWSYIQRNWEERSWVVNAKKMMADLWETYKPQGINLQPSQPELKSDNAFLKFLEEQDGEQEVVDDEYAHYCAQPTVKLRNALDWWLQPTQQQLYPHLSKLALDILSIPAMSAEPERLFSATKLIITDSRNKLSIGMIEALACLRSWYKLKEFIMGGEELLVEPQIKEDEVRVLE